MTQPKSERLKRAHQLLRKIHRRGRTECCDAHILRDPHTKVFFCGGCMGDLSGSPRKHAKGRA